jgi:hypothetical protein
MDLRSMARAYTESSIRTLGGYATGRAAKIPPAVRVAAIAILLDRGWGRVGGTASDIDGNELKVTIRHIIEDSRGFLIEGSSQRLESDGGGGGGGDG